MHKVIINAEILGKNYYDTASAIISTSEEYPTSYSSKQRIMSIYGEIPAINYESMNLSGGKVYYLHLQYKKTSSSTDSYEEYFKINSIKVQPAGEIISKSGNCINNLGNLTLSTGVTLETSAYYTINNSKDLEVQGATIKSQLGGIYNDVNGNIDIDNSIILVDSDNEVKYGIYNNSTGDIIINHAEIKVLSSDSEYGNKQYVIYNNSTGTIQINNGYFLSDADRETSYGLYNLDGKITITGGKIISDNYSATSYGIYNNNGEIYISGGQINTYSSSTGSYGYTYGITNKNGVINISGGSLTTNSVTYAYGIDNDKILNISGGNILVDVQGYANNSSYYSTYGISNSDTVNISNGTLIVQSKETSKASVYGISNSSTVTLGINNGMVNISEPQISVTGGQSSYGISNATTKAEFNFYDGKISAGTATIYGNITEVAPGYEIKKTTADGISTDILALSATDNTVCILNSINYSSLQDALDACTGTENYTISLTNVCELTEPLIIPEGKNITLSINGFDIYYDGSDSMIINNGTLTIKDTNTVSSGNLSNTIGNVIENNGTLIIGDNDGNVTSRSPHITGTDIAITNNGTIEFYDGTITGITPISGNDIKTIPEDYNLVETTENNLKTLSLIGIAPEVTYTTENVSGGTKITVTATDTNLSMIINPDDSEVTGSDTEIVSEYIATSSGMYTFKAIDKNNNITTINVAV